MAESNTVVRNGRRWAWVIGGLLALFLAGMTGYITSQKWYVASQNLQLETTTRLGILTADQVTEIRKAREEEVRAAAFTKLETQKTIESILFNVEILRRAMDELRAELARQGAVRR